MIQKYLNFIIISIFLSGLSGCNNKNKADISDIRLDVDIKRFESKLFTLPKDNFASAAVSLREEEPVIYRMYVENILALGPSEKNEHLEKLKLFVFDPYWQEVYHRVKEKYKNLDTMEQTLEKGFKRVKYFFPEDTIPEIYTIVKGIDLKYKVVSYENIMAISLDMYLGRKFKYYPSMYHRYEINNLAPPYIPSDVMKNYFITRYPEEDYSGNTMLSKMIYEGKKLYFLDLMLPDTHDSLKVRYSEKGLGWAEYYAGNIWQTLIENEMLFETEHRLVNKYFSEGPFTNAGGIPHNSPPRLGEWMGWQIIKEYMERNSDITPEELFSDKDAQGILRASGYKPKPVEV